MFPGKTVNFTSDTLNWSSNSNPKSLKSDDIVDDTELCKKCLGVDNLSILNKLLRILRKH